nr:beta family protein [Moraxella osloensis]
MKNLLYVPILQSKRGEYSALFELSSQIKDHIKPMIVLTQQDCEARATGLAKTLDDKWKNLPSYIDLTNVTPFQINNVDYVDAIVSSLLVTSNPFSLVIDVNNPYQKIIDNVIQHSLPACLKVEVAQFDNNTISKIQNLINILQSTAQEIDIFINFSVDIKSTRTAHAHYIDQYYTNLKNNLTNYNGKYIIGGSSIPKDLPRTDYQPYGLEPRIEWLGFDDFIGSSGLVDPLDKPIFADYSITYPFESEPITYVNPNAKVRYTISDNYLFAVGYQVLTHADGFGQYHDISAIIVNSPYFMGGNYSWGDKYLEDCASRTTGCGNMETWVRVGHNHHITFVTRDIASRYGISL